MTIILHLLFCHMSFSRKIPTLTNSYGSGMFDGAAPRIIGGICVSSDSYPWFVKITFRLHGGYSCGGTLLDRYTIITAAHCFAKPLQDQRKFISVYYFNHNQPLKDLFDVKLGICSYRDVGIDLVPAFVHIHPLYKVSTRYAYRYDAAVIKIAQPEAANVSKFVSLFNASEPQHLAGVKKRAAPSHGMGSNRIWACFQLPSRCQRKLKNRQRLPTSTCKQNGKEI